MSRRFEVLSGFENLASIPERATSKSAGYDLKAAIEKEILLAPKETMLIPTGLTAKMEDDEELQIRSRSGLSLKGIIVLNAPGTVDSDYYGHHVQVILHNLSDKTVTITPGMRIAQGIFGKYLVTDEDYASKNRDGGFGHTGTN